MEEKTYIYIDESGDIAPISEGGKPLFLVGCVITDDPISLNESIAELKEMIKNSAYFFRHKENFEKEGFHASTNHPDIYAKFVELLNTLNFRAYVVFADKTSDSFSEAIKQHPDFYSFLLKILLKDRLLKRRDEKIHIVLEQNTTKRTIEKAAVAAVLKEVNDSLISEGLITHPIDVTFGIQGKNEDAGVDVVDYVNHVIYTAKVGDKNGVPQTRYKENLALIEPKMALVRDLLNKRYYEGRKETTPLLDFLNSV